MKFALNHDEITEAITNYIESHNALKLRKGNVIRVGSMRFEHVKQENKNFDGIARAHSEFDAYVNFTIEPANVKLGETTRARKPIRIQNRGRAKGVRKINAATEAPPK